MDQRRAFALIFSSVICAFVLTFSVVPPGLGPAPQHSPVVASAPGPDADELMMTSLHLEARNALALLQASAKDQ